MSRRCIQSRRGSISKEYPPGGARHRRLAPGPEVDVEGDDGREDGDREENGREEDVLAHERDREGSSRGQSP